MDHLIKSIYHGPLESSLWESFLELLRLEFDSQYATLLLRPPSLHDKGVVLNAVVQFTESYHGYRDSYFAQDPFVNLPLGEAFTLDERVDINAFKQSQYYLEYLYPCDTEYLLGGDLACDKGFSARLRLARGRDGENFTAEDKKKFSALLQHLEQAIELYTCISHAQSRADIYQSAFDQMQMGCVILNADFSVLSSNLAADKLMAGSCGMKRSQQSLQVGNSHESQRFKALLQTMLAAPEQAENRVKGFKVANDLSVAGLGLLVKTVSKSSAPDGGPAFAVYFSDPLLPKLKNFQLLEDVFALTTAEAKLALLLANGLSLDEAAEHLQVTRNTAKSHLSAVFAKTGVTRQPSLVQLILSSVACIG